MEDTRLRNQHPHPFVDTLKGGDVVVILLAFALLIVVFVKFWSARETPGFDAQLITPDGKVQLVSLLEDRELRFQGPLGVTVLEVRKGRVRFISSPCQGKQCIHAGWLSHNGDFAACLPNRISLAVKGGINQYDSINF